MKKKIKISVIFLIGLFCLTAFMPLVSATTYAAGDTVTTRSPGSGLGYSLITKPKYMEYTLVNPAGDIVYQANHELIYLNPVFGFLGWEFYDEYSIQIPGFPMEGEWAIQKRLYTEFFFIVDLPASIPDEYSFDVVSSDLLTNLLAPFYITIDMGTMLGRVSFPLPCHPILIFLVIAIIVIAILLIRRIVLLPRKNINQR